MHRLLLVPAVIALLVGISACKKDPGPTQIDVEIVSSTAHLDRLALEVRDQSVDKENGYTWATLDFPNIETRDLVNDPALLRLKETAQLKDKPFLLYGRGYVTDSGASGERLVVSGALTLKYTEHTTEKKRLRLTADFAATDSDNDGFRACGSYTAPLDPEEQGYFDDSQYCDCNDNNDLINPFNTEICGDGIDNNCTGWPFDENCTECTEDQPCTNQPVERWSGIGVGRCTAGVRRCEPTVVDGRTINQLSDTCEGEVVAADDEILGDNCSGSDCPGNGIDDDCDGAVDEGAGCTETSRPCFLGLVGQEAIDRAKGVCVAGTQSCVNGQWANVCVGETRPQRPPRDTNEQDETVPTAWTGIGYFELEVGPLKQCDGYDNDCDGYIDEEISFDVDGDSYTRCGTMDVPPADGSQRNHVKSTSEEEDPDAFLDAPSLIDCNDNDSSVSPAETEVCNNGIDDDCRCDRGTHLGEPSERDGGCGTGAEDSSQLVCDGNRGLAYNGDVPAGYCDELPGPYYLGVSATDIGGEQTLACFPCRAAYGVTCDSTGTCAVKSVDCAQCSSSELRYDGVEGRADAEARRICSVQDPTGCQGATGPKWLPITAGTDGGAPNNSPDERDDCDAISCAGYYNGYTSGSQVLCRKQSDASAEEVKCAGLALCDAGGSGCCQSDGTGCCESQTDVCTRSHGDEASLTTQRPTTCHRYDTSSGCHGTQGPTEVNQEDGSDLFDDCRGGASCIGYYAGFVTIATVNGVDYKQCYPKANLTDTTAVCNNGGTCRDAATACAASTNGAAATPVEHQACKYPTSGCSGTSAPSGWTNVPQGLDPYGDCASGETCNGSGQCKANQGQTCSADTECNSGHCADSVCCDQACTGGCEVCTSGVCTTRSAGENSECAACNACNGTSKSCVAQTGASGNNCTTTDTYCCSGSCVSSPGNEYGSTCGSNDCAGTWTCSGTSAKCSTGGTTSCATCTGDTRVTGTCTSTGACSGTNTECAACLKCRDQGTTTDCGGYYGDDTSDSTGSNTCQSPSSCNGSGSCVTALGSTCSSDGECSSGHCVDSHCCSVSACGQCQACDDTGSCVAVDASDDAGCDGFCCAGTCVESSGYGSTCGNGDCSNGTWGCSGSSSLCSTSGAACNGACGSGDRIQNGMTCDTSGTCSGSNTTTECAVCTKCQDDGATASCVGYGSMVDDNTSPNQCNNSSNNCGTGGANCTCSSANACKRETGESCSNGSDCASGTCSVGTCN